MSHSHFSAYELIDLLKSKKISPIELVEQSLKRVQEKRNLNSLITVNNKVIDDAKNMKAPNSNQKLWGLPITIKDLICTEGLRTTAGSKMLENYIPPYSATLVEKLKNQGALIIGKNNLDEFAMGSSNETSYFGAVSNPWDENYVSGGSSGGSAAAVAAGISSVSIGTDTGGSIRQPAHFCGVVGLKPTYGRISRYGMIAFASSLDQAGPLTRTVQDSALVSEVLFGKDQKDNTCADKKVPAFSRELSASVKGKKIAVFDFEQTDSETIEAMNTAQNIFKAGGATVETIEIPYFDLAIPVYYMISASEASSNLSRYDGVRYGYRHDENLANQALEDFYRNNRTHGFGDEVKRRILIGTYALSKGYYDEFYMKACRVRRLMKEAYEQILSQFDFILSPVSVSAAFKKGEKLNNPVEMYLNDIYTTSTNLVGLPALTLPIRLNKEKLPIGVQLIGRYFDEQTLFNSGVFIENEVAFKQEKVH